MALKTQQEQFWAGEFGDQYVRRNKGQNLVAANLALFGSILRHLQEVSSVIEFGPNIGMNLIALHQLLPEAELTGVELNEVAARQLATLPYVSVVNESFLNYSPAKQYDMVLCKGVLIHTNPDFLEQFYNTIYSSARRYICLVEYYNPTPVSVSYRGHESVLFKRDFAGEMLDRYTDLCLLDYGFAYHRGKFPQDDLTWFVLEKR